MKRVLDIDANALYLWAMMTGRVEVRYANVCPRVTASDRHCSNLLRTTSQRCRYQVSLREMYIVH